jgi:photosystem II stability/assembly factor-like uncharacterized protein
MPSIVYAGAEAGFFRSTDGGATWPTGPAPGGPADHAKVVVDPAHAEVILGIPYVGSPSVAKRSDDGGTTWFDFQAAIVDSASNSCRGHITDAVFAPNAGAIYVTGLNCATNDNFFVSVDGGATWQGRHGPGSLRSIHVAPNDERRLWALGGGEAAPISLGVVASQDGGATWSDWAPPTLVQQMVITDALPPGLYAAGTSGVYRRDLSN